MKQKMILILTVMGVMFSLSACTASINTSRLTDSTVVVSKEGTIVEISVEDFSKSYYSFDDLSTFVNDAANEFNAHYTGSRPAMTIGAMEAADEKARVEMVFADTKAYEVFHGNIFMNTDITGLSEETRALSYITRDKGEEADIFALKDSDKYKALVTDSALNLMVEGNIEYYSDNVTLLDKNHVKTTDDLSVIIYK